MKLTIVPAGQDLITLVKDYLLSSTADLSQAIVVFPEKRPGHYLRKALGEKIGHSYLPPTILSFDELVDFLYSRFLGRNDPLIETVEAVSLLFDLNQENPESSFAGRKEAFLTFDEFFPVGQKIFQDLEELKMAQVTTDKFLAIDELAGQKLPDKTRTRLQKLSYFYGKFYQALDRLDYSSRASRLEKVVEKIEPSWFSQFDQIILAGFYLLTASEFELLNKVLDAEKAKLFVLRGTGLEAMLKRLKIDRSEIEELPEPEENSGPDLEFNLSPDSHGQLFLLNNFLSDKIAKPSLLNEKQVIVLPAVETLIPVIEQTLAALPENSYNISVGYPLTRTPLYNFFDCLFNLAQRAEADNSATAASLSAEEKYRLYVPDYLNFVLHPYTKNIYFPGKSKTAEPTRILFHLIERNFNRKKGKLFWSLKEITDDPGLREGLVEYTGDNPDWPETSEFIKHLCSIHQATIVPFFDIENINDFAAKLIDLLDYITEKSTARLHVLFEPYARAFYEQLEILKNPFLARQQFSRRSGYFQLFRQLFSESRVRFPGTPLRGLQVLGFWETRCLKFDEVYLLDMNDDILPGTNKVDSLLPSPLRKALGLPGYEELEKRIEYYLSLLEAGARKVHFSFVENSQKQKSRYVEKALWQKQKQENESEASKYIRKTSYQIALKAQAPPEIHKGEKILNHLRGMEFSASSLNTYLKCPLEFFYAHVLSLSEKEELSESLEKNDIGTLVHAILNHYFQPYLKRPLPTEPDLARLNKLIDDEFNYRRYPSPLSGSFFLMKEQIRQHLTEFLENYQKKVVSKLKESQLKLVLLELERKFKLNYQLGGRTFHLEGRIDRVERRGQYICLLDYKTSASEKNQEINFKQLDLNDRATWPEAIRSLQLPFYQLLASSELSLPPEDIYSAIIILGRNYLNVDIEYSPLKMKAGKKSRSKEDNIFPLRESGQDKSNRQENFRLIDKVINELLLEIIDESQPFSAKWSAKDSCLYCPFTGFCGK